MKIIIPDKIRENIIHPTANITQSYYIQKYFTSTYLTIYYILFVLYLINYLNIEYELVLVSSLSNMIACKYFNYSLYQFVAASFTSIMYLLFVR